MNPVLTFLRWLAALMVATAVFFLVLLVAARPASAQTAPCMSVDQIIQVLADRYGEEQTGSGVAGGGAVFLIFATPDGASWTAVVVRPDGMACMMASGTGWAVKPATPAGSET